MRNDEIAAIPCVKMLKFTKENVVPKIILGKPNGYPSRLNLAMEKHDFYFCFT